MSLENALIAILPNLQILLIMAVANLVLGILVAVKNKEFDWSRLTDWLSDYLLPVLGWSVLAIIAYLIPEETWTDLGIGLNLGPAVAQIAFATVALMIGTAILGNLVALGVLPESIVERLTRRNGTWFGQFLLPDKTGAKG